jgi:hypothetical protein
MAEVKLIGALGLMLAARWRGSKSPHISGIDNGRGGYHNVMVSPTLALLRDGCLEFPKGFFSGEGVSGLGIAAERLGGFVPSQGHDVIGIHPLQHEVRGKGMAELVGMEVKPHLSGNALHQLLDCVIAHPLPLVAIRVGRK